MKNKIKFDDGSYLVEVTPHNWAQFACRAHTQYGYPDGGKNAALRAASPKPEDIVMAYNEHAALVAVVEAAANEAAEHDKSFRRYDRKPANLHSVLEQALAALAAVRAGQPVAAVKYEEAVFNTKEDAEFWITQERRKAGFHVIEAAKATGGFKVVFERRKSSQPETAPVDHLPLVDALMKIASWSEGDEVSGHFDEPSSATIARKALAAVGIMGGVK